MPQDVLLEAAGIVKRYGAVTALRNAALSVRAGEVHALMGANGAGKSTLVKILTGAVRPDGGRITIRDRQLQARSPAEARRAGAAVSYWTTGAVMAKFFVTPLPQATHGSLSSAFSGEP